MNKQRMDEMLEQAKQYSKEIGGRVYAMTNGVTIVYTPHDSMKKELKELGWCVVQTFENGKKVKV